MRGQVLSLREQDFILAARVVGVGDWDVLRRHLLPNVLGPVSVAATLGMAEAILTEAGLSFLGLGVQPPTATWGSMLKRANNFMFLRDPETEAFVALHLLVGPGLLIFLTVLALYLTGDGLRDALDPMMKNIR